MEDGDSDLFRDYATALYENTQLASDTEFESMAIGFYKAGMIGKLAQVEYVRKRAVGQLFDAVSLHVNANKVDRLEPALKIMEKCSTLKNTVEAMRRRIYPICSPPTQPVPNVSASPFSDPHNTSTSSLGINDHSDVCNACRTVGANWRNFGARLGVLEPTLATIEHDHRFDAERCLSEVIKKWLRRPKGEVHESVESPTWKSFCEALSYIDRTLAEEIARNHGFATQQTNPDIYQKEPERHDIQPLLSSLQMSPKWFEIGTELGVKKSVLKSLCKKGEARTDEQRLGEVLEEWIDSQCSDVTWGKIIEVLKNLRKNKQAQRVAEYLEQEEVLLKYQRKKDFKHF